MLDHIIKEYEEELWELGSELGDEGVDMNNDNE